MIADVLPYISPEQTGRMNRGVDYRTDLYALGVILYQMLTGQRPFEALDPMELIHAHLALAPAPPSRVDPTIPEAVSGVVLKLLAKNAEDRYQSAEGLLADLDRCREALRGTGTIEPFVAGQHDRQDLFRIHQKLYGREQDIEALTAAFERALEGSRESVLVSGYSGIGKSSLVQEILKPLARQKGYFTSGKYDQYNRDAPYSAVIQAFDGLVRQILTESEARIQRWRSAILEALGPNAQVVCDVIPSLGHVVGAQPPVPALGPLEAQNRLNRCFLQFVSVFARGAHPLALFLDDLQWIDPASLGLLRTLLADDALEALFFCGAYRDNEVSPGHPFVRAHRGAQARRARRARHRPRPARAPAPAPDALGQPQARRLRAARRRGAEEDRWQPVLRQASSSGRCTTTACSRSQPGQAGAGTSPGSTRSRTRTTSSTSWCAPSRGCRRRRRRRSSSPRRSATDSSSTCSPR